MKIITNCASAYSVVAVQNKDLTTVVRIVIMQHYQRIDVPYPFNLRVKDSTCMIRFTFITRISLLITASCGRRMYRQGVSVVISTITLCSLWMRYFFSSALILSLSRNSGPGASGANKESNSSLHAIDFQRKIRSDMFRREKCAEKDPHTGVPVA